MNRQYSPSRPPHALDHRKAAAELGEKARTVAVASSRALAVAALAASLALLTGLPSVASAKQARLFAGSFGEATSTPANPYPLLTAGSVAVDSSSHDVYVADSSNHRVEKFDSSGAFLFMVGQEVNKTAVEESATRKAEENLCPAAGHPADICQPGSEGAGAGAFLDPQYLAVDNSPSSSKGDLYVANTGEIDEVQTVTVTATGGTFTLSFEGETTAPIAFNAESANGGRLKTCCVQACGDQQATGRSCRRTMRPLELTGLVAGETFHDHLQWLPALQGQASS